MRSPQAAAAHSSPRVKWPGGWAPGLGLGRHRGQPWPEPVGPGSHSSPGGGINRGISGALSCHLPRMPRAASPAQGALGQVSCLAAVGGVLPTSPGPGEARQHLHGALQGILENPQGIQGAVWNPRRGPAPSWLRASILLTPVVAPRGPDRGTPPPRGTGAPGGAVQSRRWDGFLQ